MGGANIFLSPVCQLFDETRCVLESMEMGMREKSGQNERLPDRGNPPAAESATAADFKVLATYSYFHSS